MAKPCIRPLAPRPASPLSSSRTVRGHVRVIRVGSLARHSSPRSSQPGHNGGELAVFGYFSLLLPHALIRSCAEFQANSSSFHFLVRHAEKLQRSPDRVAPNYSTSSSSSSLPLPLPRGEDHHLGRIDDRVIPGQHAREGPGDERSRDDPISQPTASQHKRRGPVLSVPRCVGCPGGRGGGGGRGRE